MRTSNSNIGIARVRRRAMIGWACRTSRSSEIALRICCSQVRLWPACPEYSATRSRPVCLASYSAMSAATMASDGLTTAPAPNTATPALAVTDTPVTRERIAPSRWLATVRACGVVGVGQQHRELVAAEAGEHVVIAQPRAHRLGDLAQQVVALLMAERIVDELEVVDVNDRSRRHPGRRAPRRGAARSSGG